ncbi:hypothetical protein ACFLZK_02325 [Patescibacteria group bacterium]
MNQDNNNPAQNDSATEPNAQLPPLPPKELEKEVVSSDDNLSQEDVEKKKEAFFKKIKLIGFIIIGGIAAISLFSLGRFAYNKTKSTYSTKPIPETTESSQEIIKKEEVPINTNEWEIYSNEKYGFSFDYPKGDPLFATDLSEDEFLVQIYSSDIIPEEKPTGENLVKGYIFQVKPLKLEARDLESAVIVKKDSFGTLCPDTASITDIVEVMVSDLKGKGFKILNCNADYSISYVSFGGYIYEITQIFKGDVGFKQVYKAKTNQILQSINIEQGLSNGPTHILYESERGFSFSYPRYLDSEYSDVPYPPQSTAEKLITVAENDNTNAVGFYYGRGGKDFEFNAYIDEQTQLLIDDYTVVKGRAPEGKKTEITIDGLQSYKYEDYTWEGNTLIYVPLKKTKGALIISKTDMSDNIFDDILESIKIED